ncbi:MAG: hypothetical protein K8S27_14130 [Candidatus Omnitrophica bacterium]|nr:hypothetical protein [Candidatus Omnitrophota bacterium]
MSDTNIKEQLKLLVAVQEIDAEIYEIKRLLKEKPEQIEVLRLEFESKKKHLNELEDKYKGVQIKQKDSELDLKIKEDLIAKCQTQLSQIKTNKEYTAKITEIESINADKSIIEERILLFFDDTDAVQGEISEEKENVAREEKTYNEAKSVVEKEMREMKIRLNELENKKKERTQDINPDLLRTYEKILAHKKGLAIVPVIGNVCGGCYMNITSQQINVLKMYSEISMCEICARIIFIKEDF